MFGHAGLAFDGAKMPHFSSKLNKFAKSQKFDWKQLDFSWLLTAYYKDIFKASKVINMPERANMIATHGIRNMNWPYKVKNVGM